MSHQQNFYLIIFLLVSSLFQFVQACSLGVDEPFLIYPKYKSNSLEPEQAIVEVTKIERGYEGYSGMCADLGIITLWIKNHNSDVGYFIEQLGGDYFHLTVPHYEIHSYSSPDVGAISPLQEDGKASISITWVDGANKIQEPIESVIKITPISKYGKLGVATLVDIKHGGGVSISKYSTNQKNVKSYIIDYIKNDEFDSYRERVYGKFQISDDRPN